MLFENFIVFSVFLLFISVFNTYKCTECIDFQCHDGGVHRTKNCFRCQNVSTQNRIYWESHLNVMMGFSELLKKFDLTQQLKFKLKDGMYCCRLNFYGQVGTKCSLSFTQGAKDGIPHFGMGCRASDFLDNALCLSQSGKCCTTNQCNIPNNTDMLYMKEQFKQLHPYLVESTDWLNKIIVIVMVVIIVMIFMAIGGWICKVIAIPENSENHSISQDFRRSLFRKLQCLPKLLSFFRRYRKNSHVNDQNSCAKPFLKESHQTFDSTKDISGLSCSGSGSGRPLMVEITASTDISLVKPVGEGRFGTVWLGKWRCDNVAIKIFSSRDERSWAREKQIYQENYLRHANVLGFVTTDSRDNGLATELWLVTDYHEFGSLYEFLRSHIVNVEQAVRMIRSITNGLSYLHMEINGFETKPSIAHRDLKSRNILVKSCGECCIGDLGLAVRMNEDYSSIDPTRVGTRRYMAPEILLDKIVLTSMIYNGGLEAFKKADIYSYSLVIWEILKRCECRSMNIIASTYEMPYQYFVSNDPSVEEMKLVVCDSKIRPSINHNWDHINPLKDISKAMQESWFEEPASRLNIMRLKKIMLTSWNEVCLLKHTIPDISSEYKDTDASEFKTSSYSFKSQGSIATNSTELISSYVSTDIVPNIVIQAQNNALSCGDSISVTNRSSVNS